MNEDTSHEEQKSVTTHSVKSDVLMSDTHVPKSPFVILEQFIESLTSVDKDCRIVITRSSMFVVLYCVVLICYLQQNLIAIQN